MKLTSANPNTGTYLGGIGIICLLLFGSLPRLFSQHFTPLYHWTFEGTSGQMDRINKASWCEESQINLGKANGILGNYYEFTPNTKGVFGCEAKFDTGFGLEFWLKPNKEEFKEAQILFFYTDRKVAVSISYPYLNFITQTRVATGKIVPHVSRIELQGTGKESLDYYLDGNWHHFAFQYNAQKGIKEIWIDGELLPQHRVDDAPKGIICSAVGCDNKSLYFTQFDNYNINFVGGIDEIAIYNTPIPSTLIQQHYAEVRAGKHYSFVVNKRRNIPLSTAPPKERKIAPRIDSKEYAPGHPNVRNSALSQLQNFPLPRYKQGHSLHRLFNWVDLAYFGGHKQEGTSRSQAIRNAVRLQEELAVNWHYSLTLTGSRSARTDAKGQLSPLTTALVNLANQYPDIPLGVITLWAQVVPADLKLSERQPRIFQHSNSHTLQNSRNIPLDRAGRTGGKKQFLSPTLPSSFVATDGKLQARYLKNLLGKLKRPINLINENGEVPFLPYPTPTLEQDPRVITHKNKLGISSWDTYQAAQKTRLRKAYSQEFLKLPQLKKTVFTWYGVDAGPQDRFEWSTAKHIHSKINGQYYSTPDFYVRWPSNWNKVKGPWRGWSWIEDCRKVEIADGDRLFSPFVAAGWNADPEENVRPSQWLGLLKCLGPIGAEFFYTGFFNVQAPFADPGNYAWQTVIPAYAQAISSYYEPILRQGDVLKGTNNIPILRTKVSDPRVLLTIRKGVSPKTYVIAASIQPESNIMGTIPDELSITLPLEGQRISCKVRRQGSVYLVDLGKQDKPVFYQLDSWHEPGHPAYWSQDFSFEAEVFSFSMEQKILTERPNGSKSGDFTQFDTYVQASGNGACSKYFFHPRKKGSSYVLRVRARNSKSSTGNLGVVLDGKDLGEIKRIKSKEWKWYELTGRMNALSSEKHMLSLLQIDPGVEIDRITLKAL